MFSAMPDNYYTTFVAAVPIKLGV